MADMQLLQDVRKMSTEIRNGNIDSGNANVYKNNNVFTIELPYSEFQYLRGWENN